MPPDEDQPDPVLDMMTADRASSALGIQLLDHGPGWALTAMTVRPDMVNGHDIAHGGMIFSLADTAFACACNGFGVPTVAAGCEITFVAPVRLGDVLTARASLRTRFGRNGIYDVTIRRDATSGGASCPDAPGGDMPWGDTSGGESAGGEIVAEFRGRSAELRSNRSSS